MMEAKILRERVYIHASLPFECGRLEQWKVKVVAKIQPRYVM